MLSPFLGLAKHEETSNPWLKLCGSIPRHEAEDLRAALAEQDVVDEEMWK